MHVRALTRCARARPRVPARLCNKMMVGSGSERMKRCQARPRAAPPRRSAERWQRPSRASRPASPMRRRGFAFPTILGPCRDVGAVRGGKARCRSSRRLYISNPTSGRGGSRPKCLIIGTISLGGEPSPRPDWLSEYYDNPPGNPTSPEGPHVPPQRATQRRIAVRGAGLRYRPAIAMSARLSEPSKGPRGLL